MIEASRNSSKALNTDLRGCMGLSKVFRYIFNGSFYYDQCLSQCKRGQQCNSLVLAVLFYDVQGFL